MGRNAGGGKMNRKCPINNCAKSISSQHFACAAHWYKLPTSHKQAILIAYKEYANAEGARDGLAAARKLETAQAEAIKAMEAR